MNQLNSIMRRHQNWMKFSAALIYAIAVAVAMNFFWEPGKIYASGITGFAQLLHTVSVRFLPVHVSISLLIFLLNVPLLILAWFKIGHFFTIFTVVAVISSSLMIKWVPMTPLINNPIICALFGAIINGAGTGLALRSDISTGGLDIIGIVLNKKTGKSIGTINIIFNTFIILAAAFMYGWPNAFYSAISIFINGRMMDLVYSRQQKLQVMIVTNQSRRVINTIQQRLRRGITIVHDAEGAYHHEEKTVLFTVISRYEMHELEEAMHDADPYAFASITNAVKIIGQFYEKERK
ncbi:MAG: YitT family protein [Candidatus Paralactobacillus gallistercoris]|uniref:YitT family protein n=1 Tax=Candidatus Paralactobacillus gallistercoris TaxID=2838724 RepID=A0A948TIZ5_9LACO|nr:YitT family protein [Candidatus Paralactobacillus gallistercoris]